MKKELKFCKDCIHFDVNIKGSNSIGYCVRPITQTTSLVSGIVETIRGDTLAKYERDSWFIGDDAGFRLSCGKNGRYFEKINNDV